MRLQIASKAWIGGALFCTMLYGCSKQCDPISNGHIENGIYKNPDLFWEMPLIGEYKTIDPQELDKLIQKGNLAIGNINSGNDCTQFLLTLEKSSGKLKSRLVVIRDPISTYPNNFDMINYLDSLYPEAAENNNIRYEGKDTTMYVSGIKIHMLDSKFTGNYEAYNRVYQIKTETTMLLILISGNYPHGFEEWVLSFERSSFSKDSPII